MDREVEELKEKLALISAENNNIREQMSSLQTTVKGTRTSLFKILIFLSITILFWSIIGKKTFSGRWFAVQDREEKIRGWWDEDGLELKDKIGVVRAKLGLFPDGSPYVQLFDQKHQLRSQLFVYPDGSGYLMLWDKYGKGVRFPPSNAPLP